MILTRRQFLKASAALVAAPAIVKAENIMQIWVPPQTFRVPDLRGHFYTDGSLEESSQWVTRYWDPRKSIHIETGEIYNGVLPHIDPQLKLIPCHGQPLRADMYPELFKILGNQYG